MPERSEWLLAGGGAKRNPRYRDAHRYASERRENHLLLPLLSRLPDAFHGDDGIPGVALTLNPRLRALGLSPSAFNLSGWLSHHHHLAAIKNKVSTNIALINTIM